MTNLLLFKTFYIVCETLKKYFNFLESRIENQATSMTNPAFSTGYWFKLSTDTKTL